MAGGQIAGIGDEGLAVALQRLFHHRMPAALDGEAERSIDFRSSVILVDRKLRQRRRDVQLREGVRGGPQVIAGLANQRGKPVENLKLETQRAVTRIGDPGLDLTELRCGEAHLTGQRLAVDESGVERRGH